MSADEPTAKGFSLKRWSQRKLDAARAVPEPAPAATGVPVSPPAEANATPPLAASVSDATAPVSGAAALPPVESLTIDSDFTAFLQPKVDETLKRQALKQLFRDPRFNVMDGLDVYIDDYSIPSPIAPDIVKQLVQGRYIFDPPKTRVNERGEVEDVPPDETVVAPADAERATSTEASSDVSVGGAPGALPETETAAAASAATDGARASSDGRVVGELPGQPDQHDPALPGQPDQLDLAIPAQLDPHEVAVPAQPGRPDSAPK
jgi:hypothetical protein